MNTFLQGRELLLVAAAAEEEAGMTIRLRRLRRRLLRRRLPREGVGLSRE